MDATRAESELVLVWFGHGNLAPFDNVAQLAGSRTLGQLLQERQWAAQEISRLRAELSRIQSAHTPVPLKVGRPVRAAPEAAGGAVNPLRLVRAKELRQMLGLSNSTLWRMTGEGSLPKPVRVGSLETR